MVREKTNDVVFVSKSYFYYFVIDLDLTQLFWMARGLIVMDPSTSLKHALCPHGLATSLPFVLVSKTTAMSIATR